MKQLSKTILDWLFAELQKRDAKLLPLRLFIGLGWIRAGVEKLVDPHWYSGVKVKDFFEAHILNGEVVFPFYQGLMTGFFTEHASFLSNLITAGELYAGLAIFFGFWMRPALLAALFMNFNFILAGAVNPSAFYIIIQMALLTSNVGRVLGFDVLLSTMRTRPSPRLGAQIAAESFKVKLFFCGSFFSLFLMLVAAPYIQTMDPAKSIEDPAMLLVILFGLQNVLCLVAGARSVAYHRELTTANKNSASIRNAQLAALVGMPGFESGTSVHTTSRVQATEGDTYSDLINPFNPQHFEKT